MAERKIFHVEKNLLGSRINKGVPLNRFIFFIILWVSTFGIFLWRITNLQLKDGGFFSALASRNTVRIEIQPQLRGVILDRNGEILADNRPRYVLVFDPQNGPWPDSFIPPSSWPKIKKPTQSSSLWPIVVTEVSPESALESLNINLPSSYSIIPEASREYPQNEFLSHFIGYVGRINESQYERARQGAQWKKAPYRPSDEIGQTGIEKIFESDLRGTPRLVEHIVDARGNEVAQRVKQPGAHGATLVVSINSKWQKALVESYREHHGLLPGKEQPGAALITDIRTGEILAYASFPTFNPRDLQSRRLFNDVRSPLLDRVAQGTYAAGSVMKPLYALAALSEGTITARTTVTSTGGIRVGSRFFPDWRAGGHGTVDVKKAIAWSVNTFFYAIAGGWGNIEALGPEKLSHWLKPFIEKTTGSNIPGERIGFVPTPEKRKERTGRDWFLGDTYNLGIGQGDLLVTPLQINMLTAYLASGEIRAPSVKKGLSFAQDIPFPLNRVTEDNLRVVREGMRETVTNGSARQLNSSQIKMAGKTGTAQWSSIHPPHAWFTGYSLNSKNEPWFAITVLVERGKEGSTAAVPVVKSFLEKITQENNN